VNHQDEKDNIGFYIEQAKMLVERLERISADSIWARRASGQRGALLKWLDLHGNRSDNNQSRDVYTKEDHKRLDNLMTASYALLIKAAQEYPENADKVRRE
jgi:hypothetical protein